MKLLRQTLKSLKATRLFSIINIAGIAIGITCTLMLAKYIIFENSTDKFHSGYRRMYFSTINATPMSKPSLISPKLFFRVNYDDYSPVEASTMVSINSEEEILYNNTTYEIIILAADTSFTRMFDFPMKAGNLNAILNNPKEIALTSELAQKIFGDENPLGKQIISNGTALTVSGILDKIPGNNSFKFDAIFPKISRNYWSQMSFDFLLLHPNTDIESVNAGLAEAGRKHQQFPESTIRFEPYSDFYFSPDFTNYAGKFRFGNKHSLFILGIIAALVLVISVFNFVNIYNVILVQRSKELGIKKTLGADYASFLKDMITEISICILAAIALSLLLSSALTPVFERFTEKTIYLTTQTYILLYAALFFTIVIIASIIPSFRYFSIDKGMSVSRMIAGRGSLLMRKVLMSAQYVVSIVLLIISLFFIKQLNFMIHSDLGFNTDNIVMVKFFNRISYYGSAGAGDEERQLATQRWMNEQEKQKKDFQYVAEEIGRNPYLHNLSIGHAPVEVWTSPWRNRQGEQDYQTVSFHSLTPSFCDLYGLKVTEGRFFDSNMDKDREQKVVINETAKKFFGIESVDDAYLLNSYWGAEESPFKVIGVVKDYHFQHLSKPVEPLVMSYFDDVEEYFMMHITPGKEAESIAFLRNLYETVNPEKVFQYEFVEDKVLSMYREDKKITEIYSVFAVIAMIITSLGLFSFSVFDVQQRFKEIGIRKVNGAKINQVVLMLTGSFVRLIIVSFIVSIPPAWYAIHRYLENFANKADVSVWIFLAAGLFTFIIAFISLIWQSWRAASRNPVEALRYE